MAESSSCGHMSYQVSCVGLRGKKTTSRCASGRGGTICGPILAIFGSKGANLKGGKGKGLRREKI